MNAIRLLSLVSKILLTNSCPIKKVSIIAVAVNVLPLSEKPILHSRYAAIKQRRVRASELVRKKSREL